MSAPVELIGWASSLLLVLTIANQVRTQWRAGTSAGVSRFLFVGQLSASLGFTTYSWLIDNWVFVATNLLMAVNAITGLAVVKVHRRRARRRDRAPAAAAAR